MSVLLIENLTYSFNDKVLYKNANMKINKGEHVVLIGPNGAGKTTLLNLIAQKISPESGTISFMNNSKIGYLDQHQVVDNHLTIEQYLKSTFKNLYEKEQKIDEIYHQIAIDYDENLLNKALKLQDELNNNDFIIINKKINNLVVGLNIDKKLLHEKISDISSGQKAKVLLAKLLLSDSEFLLLDEPTNFLDVEQVNWLADFLKDFPRTYLIISHDQNFINKVAKIIYEIDNLGFHRYVGNFETYLELNDLRKKQYLTQYKMQQREIKKLETYVAKNIARKSTSKSAKSRQKVLDKMVVLNKPKELPIPHFNFKYRQPTLNVLFEGIDLKIGYHKSLISKSLNFVIKADEKWLIKGHNGVGKTTFLKTITSIINPISGKIINHNNEIRIGYFQENISEYGHLSPLQYLQVLNENLSQEAIRRILANFAIKGQLVEKSINLLSGGEQTKVQLSTLSIDFYHALILDEPTNHLDRESKESLLKAINEFPGTVLMTTHDSNIDQKWANKILDFENL